MEIDEATVIVAAKSYPLTFPLQKGDACTTYALQCPLRIGQQQKINVSIYVEKKYVNLPNLRVQASLQAKNNREVGCISIPVRLINVNS